MFRCIPLHMLEELNMAGLGDEYKILCMKHTYRPGPYQIDAGMRVVQLDRFRIQRALESQEKSTALELSLCCIPTWKFQGTDIAESHLARIITYFFEFQPLPATFRLRLLHTTNLPKSCCSTAVIFAQI
jgi:hypothetical protein